ncbi:major facilitator superfamily domain-containing protein [Lactifluus volemus]|nr:major facilitator superfamily domain-containing protein [Lactifluus volemus]
MSTRRYSESTEEAKDSPAPGYGLCQDSSLPLAPLTNDGDRLSRRFWRRTVKLDLDAVATQPSVFDDPVTLELYRPPPSYENTHRFDPNARWTWREEKRLVRKIDLRIMLWAFVMFFALDLDRSNISQANTDNFLEDLHITTTTSIWKDFIPVLPSQLISKRVGPDVWIPTQMVLWSVVSWSQYWLSEERHFSPQGESSACAVKCPTQVLYRSLLGFLQGGFIPDTVLYLSFFYTKTELPIRLAWFWISNYMTQIVGAFLAAGILALNGYDGVAGWRYLFLIEGIFTCVCGLLSFALMPPGPTQTKAWFRPNGWFTEREEVIMVNRVLRDDPSKSDMHNRQGLTLKMIWNAVWDWRMWPIYILGLIHLIPVEPSQQYLTLILRNLGFNTEQSNFLSVPASVIGAIGLLGTAYLSEVIDSRVLSTVILQLWALPLLIALYTFTEHTSQWVYFAVVTLIVGYPYVHPIQVAWASRNSNSVRTRTVSASMYNISVQLGSIIGANIYRADDAPLYKRGNRDLISLCVMNIVLYIFTFFFYRSINRRREKIWFSMTPKEQAEYLKTTKDVGNERLDFRFAY